MQNNKKHILILSFTDAQRDPRVRNQILLLRKDYCVTVAGLGDPKLPGVCYMKIVRKPKRSFAEFYRAFCLLLGVSGPARKRFVLHSTEHTKQVFDLVICNDAEPLPLAFKIAKGAPVLFDAHEFYPLEFEESVRWRIFMQRHLTQLCTEFVPRCTAMTTVCRGIADRYLKDFGKWPTVLYSVPPAMHCKPSPTNDAAIRMVYHGAANRDRGIEQIIDALHFLDNRFLLDFYLVGDNAYIRQLQQRARNEKRIQFKTPVPIDMITTMLNEYDLGLCFYPTKTFNVRFCLPNKFFEFIQSRLGLVVGASPEMARIVRKYGIGVVVDSYSAENFALALNSLSSNDIICFKLNAHKASVRFNAEIEMKKLQSLVSRIL